jgi:hypothetical protein
MGYQTTIPIDSDVRDRLRAEKTGDETYSDVIERLLDMDEEWYTGNDAPNLTGGKDE